MGDITYMGFKGINSDTTIKGELVVTGSIELTGAVTASKFNGDGSALTNVEGTDPNSVVFSIVFGG